MARKLTLDFLKTEAASGLVLGAGGRRGPDRRQLALVGRLFRLAEERSRPSDRAAACFDETITEWIKEGLMAIFFLVVGLEIKYEILHGELSDPRKLATPVLAALGGMVAPALVYLAVAGAMGGAAQRLADPAGHRHRLRPGRLRLVGKGLPPSLRVFLLTLAIVDDLGAIALIAVLFSQRRHLDARCSACWRCWSPGAIWAGVRRIPAPFWVMGFAAGLVI